MLSKDISTFLCCLLHKIKDFRESNNKSHLIFRTECLVSASYFYLLASTVRFTQTQHGHDVSYIKVYSHFIPIVDVSQPQLKVIQR